MRIWLAGMMALAGAGSAAAYTVPPIEPIYGVTVGKEAITVRVASNGCTRKSDLTVAVAKNPPRPMVLIARKHPDTCRSVAAGHAEVVYSFEELGLDAGQPFALANPLVGDPGP
ncbi:MAG: hypothetical protein JWO72_1989 [Caulobacteraceae bacterium]|jgi:hypothetical protein|nr:hypothetical protein [Caulobacteraceae bacterium]